MELLKEAQTHPTHCNLTPLLPHLPNDQFPAHLGAFSAPLYLTGALLWSTGLLFSSSLGSPVQPVQETHPSCESREHSTRTWQTTHTRAMLHTETSVLLMAKCCQEGQCWERKNKAIRLSLTASTTSGKTHRAKSFHLFSSHAILFLVCFGHLFGFFFFFLEGGRLQFIA